MTGTGSSASLVGFFFGLAVVGLIAYLTWLTDVMRGVTRNREFVVFGYRYVTGSGKNRKVHH
jgi:hypothetical protein